MMIISDLEYLELASEETDIIGGDSAEAQITAVGKAEGDNTRTMVFTNTQARDLPGGGAVAYGYGVVVAISYPSPASYHP